jgi:uncharacterized protein (DUF4415 family)
MTVNAKTGLKPSQPLPTMDDLTAGRVTLDEYELAHGEDIPEFTLEDFKRARPLSDFPELAEAMRRARGERGPQIAPVKQRVGLRLDADILAKFRASGRGWQARVNDVLKQHLNDAEGHKK